MVRTKTTNKDTFLNRRWYIYTNTFLILNIFLHFSPVLEADKNIDDGVNVFPLIDTVSQPCLFDVSIFKNSTTDLNLCFFLFTDTSEVYK